MKMVKLLICSIAVLFFFASVSCALDYPKFYGREIIVTAARLPQPLGLTPWNVSLVSQDDIRFSNAENVGDILQTLPGVDVRSSGYLGSAVTARIGGSTSQQVLVLLNGRRINSPLLGLYDLGDLLLSDIERIEVVHSPLSALYGSDAVGGAVNIISKKSARRGGWTELKFGSFNTQKLFLSSASEAGGLCSHCSFQYLRSDGFRDNGDYLAQSLRQSMVFDPWEIDIGFYNSEKGVPGVPSTEAQPASSSTPGNRQKDLNIFLDLNYKTKGEVRDRFRAFGNQLNQKYRQYNFFTGDFEDSSYNTQQFGLELAQERTFKKNAHLQYGLELRSDSGQSHYAGDHTICNYAAYFQQDLQGEGLSLDMGARVDKHSVSGVAVSPRAGMALSLTPDTYLKISYAHAYKAPTLNDLYWNDAIWQMYGNQGLKPEKIRQLNVGIEKHENSSSLRLNYYTSITRDLIVWNWDPATFVTRAENLGTTRSQGLEMELRKRPLSWLGISANYTWQSVVDLQNELRVAYSPENKYNLSLRFFEALQVSGRHIGEQYADNGNTILVPAFSVVDLKYLREFFGHNLELGIDNVFDTAYYESVGYHPVTFAISRYPMPGRSIYFGVRRSY